MRFLGEAERIDASDEEIAAAVEHADVPALLVAVAHLTGDRSILTEGLRPDPLKNIEENAGFTAEQLAEGRRLATEALARHRDAGSPAAPTTSPEVLDELMGFLVGAGLDEHRAVLREELALDGEDLRAPTWTKAELAPDRPMRVAVIGAGMSGLVAAHRLGQAGIDHVVLEKDADVGGTWYENTYPGCRVDVPNHFYSYSFAQTGEWPGFFSTQASLLEYFRACADALGIRPHIRFDTEVLSATWDESRQQWLVETRDGGGRQGAEHFDAVVSAVGQLNRPSFPDIAGRDAYEGETFHSARWRHDVDLTGKRVAVIGTGASAAQFIPHVAQQAGELTVFQRTPPWLIPTPNYHDDLPDGLRWVLRHVPDYARWDRLWLFWRTHEGLLPCAYVDPEWPGHPQSVSVLNEFLRQMLLEYYAEQFPDPVLHAKVVPTYPPLAKRIVRDNGIWAETWARDDTHLVTDGIAEITPKGVRTVDGIEHEVDVLIYGTGFQASSFLTPMRVVGRDGVDLHERWGGEARAYLGLTIPGFPNLFLMYGPNTNIVINGSIIYFSECEARYITESMRLLLADGRRSMDCRPEVHDAYNADIDEANGAMAWGASSVNSWYKNASGRVAQNWPHSLLDYWQRTRSPDPDDYVLR
jgi:4-hydroxyacetophenone monooxygenase